MGLDVEGKPIGRLAAFSTHAYRAYWLALIMTGFAVQILTVAVGWYVYNLTGNPLDLGLVGLSQFLPALLLVLVTGSTADRFSRRSIMAICLCAMAGVAVTLLYITSLNLTVVWPVFVAMALFGVARSFYNPARQSIVPNIVPRIHLAQAIATNSTGMQLATICGPVLGGFLYAATPGLAYGVAFGFLCAAALLVFVAVPKLSHSSGKAAATWETVSAGFRYIWSNKPVLGAISLDLFAVLFGGTIALLPVYARDVLAIGPEGLGLLRAGPAVGAIFVGLLLILRPIRNHAGLVMFTAVAGFGIATLVFALSDNLWLSVCALVILGACDMVSVNIRSILLQLWTPDEVRGRVNAVNQVFIGASNELGAFRAGIMAVWIGPIAAVAVGGAAILVVAGVWSRAFPQLRDVKSLQ
jgi:MFS family permease